MYTYGHARKCTQTHTYSTYLVGLVRNQIDLWMEDKEKSEYKNGIYIISAVYKLTLRTLPICNLSVWFLRMRVAGSLATMFTLPPNVACALSC